MENNNVKYMTIFVFGSNTEGRHGAGAARFAHDHLGAEWGVGEGPTGKCYALPTKGYHLSEMTTAEIRGHVEEFFQYATNQLGSERITGVRTIFKVTQVGCGLGGHTADDIAPMFLSAPSNCYFDLDWKKYLGDTFSYWGRFGTNEPGKEAQ